VGESFRGEVSGKLNVGYENLGSQRKKGTVRGGVLAKTPLPFLLGRSGAKGALAIEKKTMQVKPPAKPHRNQGSGDGCRVCRGGPVQKKKPTPRQPEGKKSVNKTGVKWPKLEGGPKLTPKGLLPRIARGV